MDSVLDSELEVLVRFPVRIPLWQSIDSSLTRRDTFSRRIVFLIILGYLDVSTVSAWHNGQTYSSIS